MKIVDIRTIPLSYRCDPPYGSAGGMQARRGGLLVEIETDERVTGIGEAGVGGGAAASVIERVLRPAAHALGWTEDGGGVSTLVAVDGVLYDLESSADAPDRVSALVGEAAREDEGWRGDPEPAPGESADGPP